MDRRNTFFIAFFSVASILASGCFWAGLAGHHGLSIALLGGLGVGFDGLKIHLLARMKTLKRITQVLSASLYGVLALISVVGCMSLVQQAEHQATANSKTMQLLMQTQAGLTRQLDNLLLVQQKDLQLGYRQRAIGLNPDIAEVKQSLVEVNVKIQTAAAQGGGLLTAAAQSLAVILPLSQSAIQAGLSWIIALLLETALLVLMLIQKNAGHTTSMVELSQDSNEALPELPMKHSQAAKNVVFLRGREKFGHTKVASSSMTAKMLEHCERPSEALTVYAKHQALLEKIKQDLLSGKIKPSVTEAKKQYKKGTTAIQQCFEALIQEGVMQKQGRQYRLNINLIEENKNPRKKGFFVKKVAKNA